MRMPLPAPELAGVAVSPYVEAKNFYGHAVAGFGHLGRVSPWLEENWPALPSLRAEPPQPPPPARYTGSPTWVFARH